MPILRVELLSGRSAEQKAEIGRALTETLHRVAGIKPEATTVVFVDVPAHNWIAAGEPLKALPTP